MVVMNTAKKDKTVSFNNYKEMTGSFSQYTDIFTRSTSPLNDFTIGSYQTTVLELNH